MYRTAHGVIILNSDQSTPSEDYITRVHDSILRVKGVSVIPTYIVDFTDGEPVESARKPGESMCKLIGAKYKVLSNDTTAARTFLEEFGRETDSFLKGNKGVTDQSRNLQLERYKLVCIVRWLLAHLFACLPG